MAITRGRGAPFLACLLLLAAGRWAAPANARLMEITISSSGLALYGIPLPTGAEPSLAANMPIEGLQAMSPEAPDLGKGQLRAVVYELQSAAPPDAVAVFYQRELGRRVELAAREHGRPKQRPDDGIRVLYFQGNGSYLAIRTEDLSRPSRITVALVEGPAMPAAVLHAIDRLSIRPNAKAGEAPLLLSPPHWEAESHFEGAQLELFKRQVEHGDATGPVVDVRRSLLRQARSLHLQIHQVPRVVPPVEILAAFHQEAIRQNWTLVSIDGQAWPEVVALYRFSNDTGMVMLRAGRAPQVRGGPSASSPGTEITRLEVAGPINFTELFRPLTLRGGNRVSPTRR